MGLCKECGGEFELMKTLYIDLVPSFEFYKCKSCGRRYKHQINPYPNYFGI